MAMDYAIISINIILMQNYQLLSKLGQGSFGIVHKARDKKTSTICVIKLINISNMSSKQKKLALEQGRILKQANSPFIVKHYNTFVEKNMLYIVMQYCAKGDLARFMKAQMGKPLKQDTIWKISIQMMAGLRDLHCKKILHRDIKSLNVFLDDSYNAKIGDLGVAKTMSTDFAHTIVGTPYYLSPEMCQEKPYNEKTDIWAMGCIMYELCAGKRPFEANNQPALILKIITGKYDSLPSLYSKDLVWVVNSCLALDYKRRPSAAYLLDMPKTKEMASKLNINLNPNQQPPKQQATKQSSPPTQSPQPAVVKKQQPPQFTVQIRKQVQTPKNAPSNKINFPNSKSKPSPSPSPSSVEFPKVTRDGEKNVKEVFNNKVIADVKPVRYSGAKRMEMEKDREKEKLRQAEIQRHKQKQKQVLRLQKQQQLLKKAQPQSPTVTPTKQSNIPSSRIGQKNSISQVQYYSQPYQQPKDKDTRKQQLMNSTVNRFLPENYKKRREIDLEDQLKIEEVMLVDSDSDEDGQPPNKKTNNQPQPQPQQQQPQPPQPQQQSQNRDVFMAAQQVVDDDDLMKEFGLPSIKKVESPQKFVLEKKPITIDWTNLTDTPSQPSQPSQPPQPPSTPKLPTIPSCLTPSEPLTLPLQPLSEQPTSPIAEQIDENQAYISSEQQNQLSHEVQPSGDDQLLIQDYGQKEQDYHKKRDENYRRMDQLGRMKAYFYKQLLQQMPQAEYKALQEKVLNCKGDEIEQFVSGWKGNIQAMNLFYRIIHFEIQIKRCEGQLKSVQAKLDDIRKGRE